MLRTKAVIFDFGGTLFTYESIATARTGRAQLLARLIGYSGETRAVAEAVRNGIAKATSEHFKRPFYLHREVFAAGWQYAAEALGGSLTADQAHDLGHAQGLGALRNIVPRPEMRETLAELRRRGLHIGAASNADEDQFQAMVDALEAETHFDSLLCSETARSCKPDAGIFLEALRRASCRPHEAIFVGDTPDMDIVGAERVGMRAVLIAENSTLAFDRGRPREGQLVIQDLSELLELV